MDPQYPIYLLYILSSAAMSLPMTAIYTYLSQDLNISPAKISSYYATIFIPTFFKLVYGYLSDTFRIFSYRRKSWIIIYSSLQTVIYLCYGFLATSYAKCLVLGIFLEICMAGYEICIDSLVVEICKKNSTEHKFQSNCMMIRWCGTLICTGISLLLLYFEVSFRAIILMTSSTGVLMTAATLLITEDTTANNTINYYNVLTKIYRSILHGDANNSPIWPVLIFIFLFKCVPNTSNIMYDYLLTKANFQAWFVNLITLCSSIASILGVYIYKVLFRGTALYKVFLLTTLFNCLSCLTQVLITTDLYQTLGLPLLPLALIDQSIVTSSFQVAYMPLLVLATHICPVGVEGGVWALVLSIADLSSSLSGYITSLLLVVMGIDKTNYTNLWQVVIVCEVIKFLPLTIIPLIRKFLVGLTADYKNDNNIVADNNADNSSENNDNTVHIISDSIPILENKKDDTTQPLLIGDLETN